MAFLCHNVLTELYIPVASPNILSDSESNIDTAYSYKWKRSSKLLVWAEDGVVFLWSTWPPERFLCSARVHISPPRPTVQKQRQSISECSHHAAVTSFETRVCVVVTLYFCIAIKRSMQQPCMLMKGKEIKDITYSQTALEFLKQTFMSAINLWLLQMESSIL